MPKLGINSTIKLAFVSPTSTSTPNGNAWHLAQQQLLQWLVWGLPGKYWLQLGDHPVNIKLKQGCRQHQDTLNDAALSNGRLSCLPQACANVVLVTEQLQQHPNLALALKEVSELVAEGGFLVISGAGSLRGQLAASHDSRTEHFSGLNEISKTLANSELRPVGYLSHGSQAIQRDWQLRLQYWQWRIALRLSQRLPSVLLPQQKNAQLRPGWVAIWQNKPYGGIPSLPSFRKILSGLKPSEPIATCHNGPMKNIAKSGQEN